VKQLISICIQARKNSSRLPDKAILPLGGSTLVEHCVINASRAQDYMQKKFSEKGYDVDLNLLVPNSERDFWEAYCFSQNLTIFAGDDDNVLDRFMKYFDIFKPEFIVRLTADCPNVPFLVINKAISIAISHRLDYVTNAWERYRTSPDGHDVEVMSAKCMTWLQKNAKSKHDQEHVTTAIRENKDLLSEFREIGFKAAVLLAKEDMSGTKTCIDTKDEYDACRERFDSANDKLNLALHHRLGIYEY
jgi:spore coat polysaccharide biosynthesis protein SpsF